MKTATRELIENHYKSIDYESDLKRDFENALIYFVEFHQNDDNESEYDTFLCKIHDNFTLGHNCIACNLNESNRRVEAYLLNYKLYDNPEYSISNLIMLLYLQVECILEYLKLLKLNESFLLQFDELFLQNKFQTLYKIKRWANFFKHPKAFMFSHHPIWKYEEFTNLYKESTDLIIDTSFVQKYYSDGSKNKELYTKLSNIEYIEVLLPNPNKLIIEFCEVQLNFYNLIKDNKIVRDIFEDKATIKNYFETEENQ
jgi:hypothetical protein